MVLGRKALGLVVALGLFASIASFGAPLVADAATPHRAAVIVDTGAGVHRVVITFTEDSISGIDALQRAKADPVIYSFNGQGGAVCRVFGVGRDAGPDCLGGQDGDNRYWAYFKAPAGTSSFTYSNVGAGTSRVHDGDVEGWKFGTGTAPEFVSLQSLVPPETPPATNPPVGPVAPVAPGATNGATPQGPAGRGPQGIADATASVSTLPVTGDTKAGAGATGPTAADRAGGSARNETRAEAKQSAKQRALSDETAAAKLASSSSDDSSSASSLIWFGLLLAAIVIAIIVARRVRRRANPAA